MLKVLITGGAGFIGSHIAAYYQGRAAVRVLDDFRSGRRENLRGLDVDLIEGSITDPGTVNDAVRDVDYVFHLAAIVSVPQSFDDPGECLRVNAMGLLNVLRAASNAEVKKLCFSSSCSVYGDDPEMPKRETMLPNPKSPYAITKLAGEYYCRMFSEQRSLKTVSLRYFNVFGPRQDPTSQYAAAIPIFVQRAINNEPLSVFGDGEQTRDFVFVEDVVAANVYFCTYSDASGTFNIGCGQSISINELVGKIVSVLHSNSTIEYKDARRGDVKHSTASNDKARAAGFLPSYTLDKGLEATLRWWREQSPA